MIGFLSIEEYVKREKIDYNKLYDNMKIISKMDDMYSKYVTNIYREYKVLAKEKSCDIKEELINKLKVKEISVNDIGKCKVIISPSHLNTYFIIKNLNVHKEDVMIICFDMHSDTYDYNDALWKGNHFSKLLKEGYINNCMIIGVPKYKIENTYKDVPLDIKSKVIISDSLNFKSTLKRCKPKRIFISIDMDVLDTRKSKYTSIDYSPHTILEQISKLNVNNLLSDNSKELVKECVLIKNDLGYANLYKIGENRITIDVLCQKINEIISYCKEKNIILGFNNIYGDISEIIGNDYNFRTFNAIIKLLTVLGGETNERTI